MSHEIVKIDFNGDNIVAFEEDTKIYVSVQQACTAIGLYPETQFKKIRQDPVMQAGAKVCLITDLFGNQETMFLEKQFFHRWLNSIQTARVKEGLVREKLIKYQFECMKALDDYFSKGSAVNENFLKAAPKEFIDNLAEMIAEKLGGKAGASMQEYRMLMAQKRLEILAETEKLLGAFDAETKSIMKQQTASDIGFDIPNAPTWTEIDRWYAADYWEVKKTDGWKNAHFKSDASLVLALGKYASRISRARGYEILEVPQLVKNGRKVSIHQYREEALSAAFSRLVEERKVTQQKIIQMSRTRGVS